jgi:hypothetical protein
MGSRRISFRLALIAWAATGFGAALAYSQSLPVTAGETLSGKRIVLADAVRGHAVVLIAGFSKDAGDGCGMWAKAVRGDAAMAGVRVYQIASLESAPGFVRGMIKSAMRKGLLSADQDSFVILTQEEKLWRSYFAVSADKDPYVVLLDASGKALWHGHGAARDLEPLLRNAKP